MSISATLLVCDDLRIEMGGKVFIIGMYTGNISIAAPEVPVWQLIFLFSVDMPLDELPNTVTFEVTLPGSDVDRHSFTIPEFAASPEHTRYYLRQMMRVQNKPLRPGRIEAKVLCDEREVRVSTPWIVVAPHNATAPTASEPPSEQSPNAPPASASQP